MPEVTGQSPFIEFNKIARLSRECIVTEKIDGTNAQVFIPDTGEMLFGSRSRWITPEADNYGFAAWGMAHKDELMKLGPGRHFGEWWGSGIQRGYGLPKGEKRFSLFNVSRWCVHGGVPKKIPQQDPRAEKYQDVLPECCGLVPVLLEGMFDTALIEGALSSLKLLGSVASPGFMKPEGVVIFHVPSRIMFKKTIEGDNGKNHAYDKDSK